MFHRARPEGVETGVDPEVPLGEEGVVPDQLRLAGPWPPGQLAPADRAWYPREGVLPERGWLGPARGWCAVEVEEGGQLVTPAIALSRLLTSFLMSS